MTAKYMTGTLQPYYFTSKLAKKKQTEFAKASELVTLVIGNWQCSGTHIIGIKIIVPIKCEKSLRLMVHISKTLTKSLR
jgi:hypothetical protein